MTLFIFLRHGPTAWNAAGRIQGHSDVPLSDEAAAQVALRRIPASYGGARWFSSPLTRARQTARLMGCSDPTIEPTLIEMNWGDWEGLTLSELRARYGGAMQENEDRGLDFRPPGGESPRDVQRRVTRWMRTISASSAPVVAVTHKGVIRAVFSAAVGWDMRGPPPIGFDWACGQVFETDEAGGVGLRQANLGLGSGA